MAGNFPASPARQLFTNTVIAVAAQAKAAMPEANGRVERARDLVLGNLVHKSPEGPFTVRSASSRGKSYTVTAGVCECPDAAKLVDGRCKHLLATWIWLRARKVIAAQPNGATPPQEATHSARTGQDDSGASPQDPSFEEIVAESVALTVNRLAPQPPQAHSEAPASVNVELKISGRWARLTLRDIDESRLLTRLDTLLKRFPIEAEATQPPAEGWCSKHGVQMTQQHNAKGAWWSHRLADGAWCKGK